MSQLKQSVDAQEKNTDQQLAKVKQAIGKQEKNTEQQFSQVKQSIDKQEKKAEQLSSIRHRIKVDVDAKLHKHDQDAAYNALKEKAYSNRNNLVIIRRLY